MEQVFVKNQLWDIALNIHWGRVAKESLHKNSSWLYERLNGNSAFTPEELEEFQKALYQLADRITAAADSLKQ